MNNNTLDYSADGTGPSDGGKAAVSNRALDDWAMGQAPVMRDRQQPVTEPWMTGLWGRPQ